MTRIGILLTTGPIQYQDWDTVYKLSLAALEKGHEVSIFLYLDGVYNPIGLQKFPDWEFLPKDRFEEIMNKGAKIIACGICVNARGLENGKDFVEHDNLRVGMLPDFADIIGEVDRLITL